MATKITKMTDANGNIIMPLFGLLTSSSVEIQSNADLNDYKTVGSFVCPGNNRVPTIANIPSGLTHAFKLIVMNTLGTAASVDADIWQYFMQILIDYNGTIYIRYFSSGNPATNINWNSWQKVTVTTV